MQRLAHFLFIGSAFYCLTGALGGVSVRDEALRIQETASRTSYSHQIFIDEVRGIYALDCSAFASYVLSRVEPKAYQQLASSAVHPKRPLARDFASFFKEIKSENPEWLRVLYIRHLKPGDLIAWLIPPGSTSKDTGHVMIVKERPAQNPRYPAEWLVPVIDSAVSGHGSRDPRRSSGPNGVGAGTIGLIGDAQGKAVAFRWAGGESPKIKYTVIRMARIR